METFDAIERRHALGPEATLLCWEIARRLRAVSLEADQVIIDDPCPS